LVETLNNVYLSHYINSPSGQQYFQSTSNTTSGLNTTTTNTVRELDVPLPPLRLQKQFARVVTKFERLRIQQREAARQAEHLFQTLLHRAFGEEE